LKNLDRKLNALEKNVLSNHPDPASIFVENEGEIELIKKANRIRQNLDVDILKIWHNDELRFEEKQKETVRAYNQLDEEEKRIVSKDTEFAVRRLQELLIRYFEGKFPNRSIEPLLRVTWFFQEMDALAIAKFMEDSEWYHNRNEDDADFDDFEWWNRVDLKIKELYPEGIFTDESWNRTREFYDKILSEYMVQYWQAHPEEFEEIKEKIEKH